MRSVFEGFSHLRMKRVTQKFPKFYSVHLRSLGFGRKQDRSFYSSWQSSPEQLGCEFHRSVSRITYHSKHWNRINLNHSLHLAICLKWNFRLGFFDVDFLSRPFFHWCVFHAGSWNSYNRVKLLPQLLIYSYRLYREFLCTPDNRKMVSSSTEPFLGGRLGSQIPISVERSTANQQDNRSADAFHSHNVSWMIQKQCDDRRWSHSSSE